MSLEPEKLEDVIKRLRRAQGQLGGIIAMIEDQRECRDIVIQLAAVGKAIDKAGVALLARNLRDCIENGHGIDSDELEKLFLTLA